MKRFQIWRDRCEAFVWLWRQKQREDASHMLAPLSQRPRTTKSG